MRKNRVTPSVTAPGDTNVSDATEREFNFKNSMEMGVKISSVENGNVNENCYTGTGGNRNQKLVPVDLQ